jgi:hypothetical protein
MAFTHLPLRRSVPIGIITYAFGYLVTVGVTSNRVNEIMAIEVSGNYVDPTPLGQIFGVTPPSWVLGGWLFYNAHFVPTSLPTADAMNGITTLTNRTLLTTVGGPVLVLYLLPVVFLLVAGYLVARTGTTFGANGDRNAGASVAFGYFPVFLIGAFVLTARSPHSGVVASPAGLPAVFLGLVYPVVFGAIGGVLADWRGEPESEIPDDEVEI